MAVGRLRGHRRRTRRSVPALVFLGIFVAQFASACGGGSPSSAAASGTKPASLVRRAERERLRALAVNDVEAAEDVTRGWIDSNSMAVTLEATGVVYQARRRAVDAAYCIGLVRLGRRALGSAAAFHQFRCSLMGADQHRYTAWITVTRSMLVSAPIPGRGEPAYLTRALRVAGERLKRARSMFTISGTPTTEQKVARAAYLRTFEEGVADAKVALEPYRTKFWSQVTQIQRDY